jgi:hypothetical protein
MAHRYPENYIAAGERVTPVALNEELGILASEVNGHICRENFNYTKTGIGYAKLASFAISRIHYAASVTNQDVSIATANATEWVEIAGAALNLTTTEAMLVIEAGANWYISAHGAGPGAWQANRVVFGVKVDEDVHFNAAEAMGAEFDFGHIDIAVPVAPGNHRVVPVIRLLPPNLGSVGGDNATVTIDNDQLLIREVRR